MGEQAKHSTEGKPHFPTMLRKMWSGGEVQAWIDANWPTDTHTHGEQIGLLADRIDNLLGAMQLPLPAQMHLDQLRHALPEIRDSLRLIYTAETGENPWG